MALVTLQQAADHLRLDIDLDAEPPEAGLADLQMKVDSASAIVTDYLKRTGWSPPWVPDEDEAPVVASATLLILSGLYDDRMGLQGDYLAENGAVARLLRRLRDPALA